MSNSIHEFRRLFIVNNAEEGRGWNSSKNLKLVFEFSGGNLDVTTVYGRDPFAHELNTLFGRFLLEYEKEFGPIRILERKRMYRFCYRTGSSGAQDTFIEVANITGFPDRRHLVHQSCFGKANQFHPVYAFDFLDLCIAGGFLTIDENNCYHYDPSTDAYSDLDTTIIKPRLIDYEEGWTWSYDKIVPLNTCRNVPTEEPEEQEDEQDESDVSSDSYKNEESEDDDDDDDPWI